MPSSKEVRARQQRQKDRIATQHAERQRTRERRRRIGMTALIIFVVAGVILAIVVGPNLGSGNNNDKVANVPTTPFVTTTTAPLKSVKGMPCVGLKDALPKGSPKFTVPAGPAPTTLITRDLKAGTGAEIKANSTVSVNYVGVACSTGKIFDSSYSRNQPLQVNLNGGVIKGWTQGLTGMRIGGVRLLSIPSNLAYGSTEKPPIAPDEALIFLVAPVKLG